MIGATAKLHDLTLVTHNTSDFQHVPGLRWEDWLARLDRRPDGQWKGHALSNGNGYRDQVWSRLLANSVNEASVAKIEPFVYSERH